MTGEAPHGVRYRCSSRTTFTEPSKPCKGYVSANNAEGRVWETIEQVLQRPKIIAGEVGRQQAGAEEQRAEILREISLSEDTMAKCDREEQRWAQAYVAEVINLAELKGYRSEIATRRHSLLAQRHGLQTDLENIGHALEHVEALRGVLRAWTPAVANFRSCRETASVRGPECSDHVDAWAALDD